MKSSLLLPPRYKMIGLCLFIPSLCLGIAYRFFDFGFEFLTIRSSSLRSSEVSRGIFFTPQNLTDEFALSGIIIGLLFIAFAREKQEDEFINKIRLESLQWAVIVNYVLLLVATWVVYNISYIDVMLYNMLTILLFFIIRFHIILGKNRSLSNE